MSNHVMSPCAHRNKLNSDCYTLLFIIPVTPPVYYSSLLQRICASIQPTAANWTDGVTPGITGLSALVISKHAKSLQQAGSQCNEVLLLCSAQCSFVTPQVKQFSIVLFLQDNKMCLTSVKFSAGRDEGHLTHGVLLLPWDSHM